MPVVTMRSDPNFPGLFVQLPPAIHQLMPIDDGNGGPPALRRNALKPTPHVGIGQQCEAPGVQNTGKLLPKGFPVHGQPCAGAQQFQPFEFQSIGPTPQQLQLTLEAIRRVCEENERLEAMLRDRKQHVDSPFRLKVKFPARRPRALPKLAYRLSFALQKWRGSNRHLGSELEGLLFYWDEYGVVLQARVWARMRQFTRLERLKRQVALDNHTTRVTFPEAFKFWLQYTAAAATITRFVAFGNSRVARHLIRRWYRWHLISRKNRFNDIKADWLLNRKNLPPAFRAWTDYVACGGGIPTRHALDYQKISVCMRSWV